MTLKRRVRESLVRVRARMARVASRSGRLSSLFYAVASRAMDRPNRAVLAGVRRYEDDVRTARPTSSLLRRNVHRLEKGLLMPDRRSVFGAGYIEETVEQFRVQLGAEGRRAGDPDEMQWADDVLRTYFAACGPDARVDRARLAFEQVATGGGTSPPDRVPYRHGLLGNAGVSYESFLALCRHRKSTRWFRPVPVPRDLLDRAVEAASLAPSACNRQPYVFRVLDDPALVREVSPIPMGTSGYAENVPVFVVVVGQLRHYFNDRDRNLIYIDASLATMNFVLAAEALGLATCCINWPSIEARETQMARSLRLEIDERPILCIAVGYPDRDALVAYSARKPLSLLRRYNLE